MKRFFSWGNAFVAGILTVIAICTMASTLAIVDIRRKTPPQKLASAWIKENCWPTSSFGIPYGVFWWTPDILTKSAIHPERMDKPFFVIRLGFKTENYLAALPDYLLVSGVERQMCQERIKELFVPQSSFQECTEFFNWLNSGRDYEIVKEFPREIGFPGWNWNRPEEELGASLNSDDIWITGLTIYKRR